MKKEEIDKTYFIESYKTPIPPELDTWKVAFPPKVIEKLIKQYTKKCPDCAFQFICNGGCVANGFQINNDIFETDIWCPYWEEIIKYIIIKIHENHNIINLIPNYNIKTK